MARRLPKQISSDIDLIRWLYWQTVRLLPSYRQATKHLLCSWREQARQSLPIVGISTRNVYRRLGRAKAAQNALRAYTRLKRFKFSDIPSAPESWRLPREFFDADSKATSIIDDALRSRNYPLPGPSKGFVESLRTSQQREDGLPELRDFTRQWGLKFPIPPSAGIPLDEIMTNGWCRPVKIARADRERLILIIYPFVGRTIIGAYVGAALDHCSRKRKSGSKMIGRLVSSKRFVRKNVTIARHPAQRIKVTIELPAR